MTTRQTAQGVREQTTFWLTHNSGYAEEGLEICRISPRKALNPRFATDETLEKLREAAANPDPDGQWVVRVDGIMRAETITCSVQPFDEPARTMLREHDRFSVTEWVKHPLNGNSIGLKPAR